jgi:hypothetical protein
MNMQPLNSSPAFSSHADAYNSFETSCATHAVCIDQAFQKQGLSPQNMPLAARPAPSSPTPPTEHTPLLNPRPDLENQSQGSLHEAPVKTNFKKAALVASTLTTGAILGVNKVKDEVQTRQTAYEKEQFERGHPEIRFSDLKFNGDDWHLENGKAIWDTEQLVSYNPDGSRTYEPVHIPLWTKDDFVNHNPDVKDFIETFQADPNLNWYIEERNLQDGIPVWGYYEDFTSEYRPYSIIWTKEYVLKNWPQHAGFLEGKEWRVDNLIAKDKKIEVKVDGEWLPMEEAKKRLGEEPATVS